MGLTPLEKQAGRLFYADCERQLASINDIDPPTYDVPVFLSVYRHLCHGRGNRSTGLELKERYWESMTYPQFGVPAGRFGFLFREGRCRGCAESARSRTGRIVDAWTRPPLTGRVARS